MNLARTSYPPKRGPMCSANEVRRFVGLTIGRFRPSFISCVIEGGNTRPFEFLDAITAYI